jgi:DNA-binding beta-propeller fold protein YncE
MAQFRMIISLTLMILTLISSVLHADAKTKFSIVPLGENHLKITKVGAAEVIYQMTNNTKITRTLTLTPQKGLVQKTNIPGSCSAQFTLAPNQSCALHIEVHGNQIAREGYVGGPVICKSSNGAPDPFLCSQPSLVNSLYVTFIQIAYVSNAALNTVLKCTLAANGAFSSCVDSGVGAQFNTPAEISIHPTLPVAYVANSNGDSVSQCSMDNDGNFVSCTLFLGGSVPFEAPEGIVLNHDGSIAYVANALKTEVSQCMLNPDGTFNNCVVAGTVPSSNTPFGIALNSAGTFAYVTCCDAVIKCFIKSNGAFGTCIDSGVGATFNFANGIVINKSDTIAYVVDQGVPGYGISVCQMAHGAFTSCRLFTLPAFFGIPSDIVLNRSETLAYISTDNTVAVCAIRPDGNLGQCVNSGGVFDDARGIALTP